MDQNQFLQNVIGEFCNQLNLNDLSGHAYSIVCELKENLGIEVFESSRMEWVACVIYMAMIESRFVYGAIDSQLLNSGSMPNTVTNLLKATNIRTSEFLKRMKTLQDRVLINGAVRQHLIIVQKKFLIACPLYMKLKKMSEEIFQTNGHFQTTNINQADYFGKKDICWLLFVYMKSIQQQEGNLKLVESFHLLLCCLGYIIHATPTSELLSPFDFLTTLTTDNVVLLELCKRYKANIEEVKLVQSFYFDAEIQSLSHIEDAVDVHKLTESYIGQYKQLGDINELDFLQNEYYLTTPSIDRVEPIHAMGFESSENLSTPVGIAMRKIQQLNNLFQVSSVHPSSNLLRFFSGCVTNPQNVVDDRLSHLEGVFINAYTGNFRRKGLARNRFKTATMVYYDAMETMLAFEEERLSQNDFTLLLNKETFHKSLLACSLEVVLHVYETHTFPFATVFYTPSLNQHLSCFAFPWILNVFSLKSFDFFKVLDSFIQVKPDMPNFMKEHLRNLENQIISYLAWTSDSPLFELIFAPSVLEDKTTTHLRITAGESLLIQNSRVQAYQELYIDSPRKTRSSSVLINKARLLGLQHLKQLFDVLSIPEDLRMKINSCFEYCIHYKPLLFRDRHVDQITMCCLYCVPKNHDHEIKFKDIIVAYKNTVPHGSFKLEKNVLVKDGERGSIIHFYNKVFIDELKDYLCNLSSNLTRQVQLSPLHDHCYNTTSLHLDHRTLSHQNITASPLRSPFKVPLTPKSRTLYYFKDSPLSPLELFSKRGKPEPQDRAIKRLKFDHFDNCGTDCSLTEELSFE